MKSKRLCCAPVILGFAIFGMVVAATFTIQVVGAGMDRMFSVKKVEVAPTNTSVLKIEVSPLDCSATQQG